eukprot:TRINITY_DN2666_c0_g1_i1.p1 TRINITY_DN2666_c0_g1~~TRINITY_DN2666_c0_g1_i1.p1  ORF type:complete len:101 (+),score=12.35 TRINITY_DN2666_c0_g1_i1:108-410(+)
MQKILFMWFKAIFLVLESQMFNPSGDLLPFVYRQESMKEKLRILMYGLKMSKTLLYAQVTYSLGMYYQVLGQYNSALVLFDRRRGENGPLDRKYLIQSII